jgi:hypothetical protein
MNIEERIRARMSARPHRRYYQYDPAFRVLLGAVDFLLWLYFFGVPFFPNALPHLSSFGIVIRFFVEGFRRGMQ